MPTRRRPRLRAHPLPGSTRSPVSRFLDITRPLGPATAVFPGDPPVSLSLALDPQRGDPARVSQLVTGTHAGTHVDAPCHLPGLTGGVDALPLDALIGPVLVVQAGRAKVSAADVARIPRGAPRRILFRGAPIVLPAAARALARRGLLLVGTDGLSIDPVEDPGLPAHAVLLAAGVVILEALDLSRAAPGRYELAALPLLLPGCDGAPARAVLWRSGKRRPARRVTTSRRAGQRGGGTSR